MTHSSITTATTPAQPTLETPQTGQPTIRYEFAIQLPSGRWWRKLSLRLADADGTGPSVYHSRAIAGDELFDVIGQARETFGVERDYRPRLMVRQVIIASTGVSVGDWKAVAR